MRCDVCGSSAIETDTIRGQTVCMDCGYVVNESSIVNEPQFEERANGSSAMVGQFVSATNSSTRLSSSARMHGQGRHGRRFGSSTAESKESTLSNGKKLLKTLSDQLQLKSHHVDVAFRVFQLAVQHNFIQGRRTILVAAACLYIACRQRSNDREPPSPILLIDFAEAMSESLYVLGATFLKLLRTVPGFRVELVDPSLYIDRFANALKLGPETHSVMMTALRLVKCFKHDWISCGRRPAGICGASLEIACRLHGFSVSHSQIAQIVRMTNSTIQKRVDEFLNTATAQLTVNEFETLNEETQLDAQYYSRHRKQTKLHGREKKKGTKDRIISNASSSSSSSASSDVLSQSAPPAFLRSLASIRAGAIADRAAKMSRLVIENEEQLKAMVAAIIADYKHLDEEEELKELAEQFDGTEKPQNEVPVNYEEKYESNDEKSCNQTNSVENADKPDSTATDMKTDAANCETDVSSSGAKEVGAASQSESKQKKKSKVKSKSKKTRRSEKEKKKTKKAGDEASPSRKRKKSKKGSEVEEKEANSISAEKENSNMLSDLAFTPWKTADVNALIIQLPTHSSGSFVSQTAESSASTSASAAAASSETKSTVADFEVDLQFDKDEDLEIDSLIEHDESIIQWKKELWNRMNEDYLKRQEEKLKQSQNGANGNAENVKTSNKRKRPAKSGSSASIAANKAKLSKVFHASARGGVKEDETDGAGTDDANFGDEEDDEDADGDSAKISEPASEPAPKKGNFNFDALAKLFNDDDDD